MKADDVLRRMLATKPEPHAEVSPRQPLAKKAKQKKRKKAKKG